MYETYSTRFDSNDVMAYILGVCEAKKIGWNLTKAQKILYCCYGVILAAFDQELTEENPQAWQYGPVFPRTINGIKKGRIIPGRDNGFSKNCNPDWLPLMDQVITFFGNYSASQLSTWSHRPGSPWDKATHGGADLLIQIPNALIKEYFSRMVTNASAEAYKK